MLVWFYPLLVGVLFLTIVIVNEITSRRGRHFSTRHRLGFVPVFAIP